VPPPSGSTKAIHKQYVPPLGINGSPAAQLHTFSFTDAFFATLEGYSFRTSLGQEHHRSRPANKLHNDSTPSVVRMLMSRSLTGRHTPNRVHQHFGQRLHLVWTGPDNNKSCTGHFFWFISELMNFCHQITRGGCVNIVACVPCPHEIEGLKVYECPILPPTDEDVGTIQATLQERKVTQECRFHCNCGCRVDEYKFIDWE
jgi:hypothetical protein